MTHLSELSNHLWQSTLFAGLVFLLTLALRRNRAQMRYWLWVAASAKFLIPFSLLVSVGSQFEWRAAPAAAAPVSVAIEQIAQPFATRSFAVAAPTGSAFDWPVAVWLCGCVFVIARWWARWRRVRMALRTASPLPMDAPIAVMSSPARLEPGVFGVFRPVLLLPEGMADRLKPAQFQAILAHELCHVRRRDNLAAAFHMVVEAVFWFHPLVWWIGARLVEERERACDEEVLSSGGEPQAYAEGILHVCRFYLESPLACASGVTGADLKKRIEAIMTNRIRARMTAGRKLLLATAGIAAVAGPLAIGIVNAPRMRAQAAPLRFEVASIKPFSGGGGRGMLQVLPGGELRMEGTTLKSLVAFAYGVREGQISGGPGWMGTEAYELLAKPERSEAADHPRTVVAPGTEAWSRLERRLQALLAERFRLAIHKTHKEEAGYALVQAKSGTRLQPSPLEDQRPAGTVRDRGRIDGRNGTMPMLATVLSQMLGRPVEDRTGLTANYTYKLEYMQETAMPGRGAPGDNPPDANPPDFSGPSIFTALQEQLGLKLESSRVRVETIVIDHAEKPSAN